MTIPEVAEMLCVSDRSVRALIECGAIPVISWGRQVLVRRTDLGKIAARGGP